MDNPVSFYFNISLTTSILGYLFFIAAFFLARKDKKKASLATGVITVVLWIVATISAIATLIVSTP